jgi:ankyrin repeat protein
MKNKILAVLLTMLAGTSFASKMPSATTASGPSSAFTTEFTKQVSSVQTKVQALATDKLNFKELHMLIIKLRDILGQRITHEIALEQQETRLSEKRALQAMIDGLKKEHADLTEWASIIDLLKNTVENMSTGKDQPALSDLAKVEKHLVEHKKKLATSTGSHALIDLPSVDIMLAQCNIIKKALSNNNGLVRRNFAQNYKTFMDIVKTNLKKEEQNSAINQCIEDFLSFDPFFFITPLPECGTTMLMTLLHPERKTTREALDLVAKQSNVNAINKVGETALMIAIKYGNTEHVKILLNAGASIDINTKALETPLITALACNNDAIINVILAEVLKLKNPLAKHNQLLMAYASLGTITEHNKERAEKIARLGKVITKAELLQSNPLLTAVRTSDQLRDTQGSELERDTDDIPEMSLPQTALSRKIDAKEKQAQENKKALEKREKKRQAREHARKLQHAAEQEAQKRLLAGASVTAAAPQESATSKVAHTATGVVVHALNNEEAEVEEVAKRKEFARQQRKQFKKSGVNSKETTEAEKEIQKARCRLRAQFNPLLRPRLLVRKYDVHPHIRGYHPSQYAPLNGVTDFIFEQLQSK